MWSIPLGRPRRRQLGSRPCRSPTSGARRRPTRRRERAAGTARCARGRRRSRGRPLEERAVGAVPRPADAGAPRLPGWRGPQASRRAGNGARGDAKGGAPLRPTAGVHRRAPDGAVALPGVPAMISTHSGLVRDGPAEGTRGAVAPRFAILGTNEPGVPPDAERGTGARTGLSFPRAGNRYLCAHVFTAQHSHRTRDVGRRAVSPGRGAATARPVADWAASPARALPLPVSVPRPCGGAPAAGAGRR